MKAAEVVYTRTERVAAFERLQRRATDLAASAELLRDGRAEPDELELLFELAEAVAAEAAYVRNVTARSPQPTRKS